MEDICRLATPRAFGLTQKFYRFCVRRMPWLWGVTYAQTETPDWAETLRFPGVAQAMDLLRQMIADEQPELVMCTYPLFAYMLDALSQEGVLPAPYVVVVTDALEISRPWMKTRAPLVCVTDDKTRRLVTERYGLPDERVVACGFPVKRAFDQAARRTAPDETGRVNIVYGAYAPTRRVCRDVRAMMAGMPGCTVTLIAGTRMTRLARYLTAELATGRLCIVEHTQEMARLFREAHLYIGKAGAATMFEAYSAGLPMVINYALPGQEQGNLQLLLEDHAGFYVESTADLMAVLHTLLKDNASEWKRVQSAMQRAGRGGAAKRIVDEVMRRFFT